jgi:ABC-2 type transport system ATP-binding protein
MAEVPAGLSGWNLALTQDGTMLEYEFDASDERVGIPALLRRLEELGIGFTDLNTRQSSLEDIFVGLVSERGKAGA